MSGSVVRRWRWPVALALLVIAAGAAIALLQPSPTVYLDPGSTGSDGGHALADIATSRGVRVVRATTPPAPGNAATGSGVLGSAGTGSAAAGTAGSGEAAVELVTSADQLTSAQLASAARFRGDLVITDPDSAALRVLAPAVTISAAQPEGDAAVGTGQTAPPLCNDPAANLAGTVDAAGAVLRTSDPSAITCYPGAGGYFFVQYRDPRLGRTVTVLGTGAPFTNAELADNGNAALALNLLHAQTITWLVPVPGAVPAGQAGQPGQRSFFSLVPWPAYLVVIQLAVALAAAAAWRARRLGPLVPEKLPVVVRASETVEGHGRLYQARRARDRAAEELRAAARTRIAARTGQPPAGVTGPVLDGPPPATDQELVALADDLDSLERKARHP